MKMILLNKKGIETKELVITLIILMVFLVVVGGLYLILRNESNSLLDLLLGVFV